MRSIPLFRSLGLAILFPVAVLAADPVAELAKFSVFGTVSLPQLAKGEIKTGQGTALSTGRFLSVEGTASNHVRTLRISRDNERCANSLI